MKPETNAKICEALSIEPVFQYWAVGDASAQCFNGTQEECRNWAVSHPDYIQQFGYAVVERVRYPDLATEAGFFTLWAALKRNGWSTCAVDDGEHCWAKLSRAGVEVRSGYYDTAHAALAAAAALALGVADE